MNPAEIESSATWCRERLGDPAEDLALAALFAPRRERAAVTVAAALYVELEAIATRARDLNIGRIKLGWWREELGRLDAGEPAHPATRWLAAQPVEPPLVELGDLVTGFELTLLEGPVSDLAGAELRAGRCMARLALVLGGFAAGDYGTSAGLLAAGRAVGLARTLNDESLDPVARRNIEVAAHAGLSGGGSLPTALRVLTALARRRVTRTGPDRGPGRTFAAWRAARRRSGG